MPDNMPVFTETATLMSDGSTVTHVSATAPDGREHGGVYTSPDQRDALIAQLTEQIEERIKTELAAYEAQLRAVQDDMAKTVFEALSSYDGRTRLPDAIVDAVGKITVSIPESSDADKADRILRDVKVSVTAPDYSEMSIDLRTTAALEASGLNEGAASIVVNGKVEI
jgi:hypothetical protein